MTQNNPSTRKVSFGHWVRVVVMFLSFGMVFPNAMTEYEDDLAEQNVDKAAHAVKQ